ncbi:MAG: hypothetical protein IJV97_00820 [Alphaproteobacteria bacterium]|nr:hypothetical protein [Alphaproteobacteria bacterium]
MTDNAALIFEGLLERLYMLPFSQTSKIKDLEIRIYTELQNHPANICGLITLMFLQIMQGNRVGAKDTAYKIWDIGGELSPYFEAAYIENLLNIGLLDMAEILLKPRSEQLTSENIKYFYSSLIKFAIITGNLDLLERLKSFYITSDDENLLYEFVEMFRIAGCVGQFKNIQKLIFDHIKNNVCAYEYNLYDDRGFADLEIEIYTNGDEAQNQKELSVLNRKLDSYWFSCGKQRLYNHSVVFKHIREHNSWIEPDPKFLEEL